MSDTLLAKNWAELYKEALLETDHAQICFRIDQAETAIKQRALELWYSPSRETRERQDLETALRFLGLLRMLGLESPASFCQNTEA